MDNKELKSIELEIEYQISIKNNFWNALVISIAGTIGLILSGLSTLKTILAVIGFFLIFVFIFGYFRKIDIIESLIEQTKKDI